MHRVCIVLIAWLMAWPLRSGANGAEAGVLTQSAPDPLEEVLVEAPEPRYAAPTLRDRIGRVWVPVMINGQGPFRLVLDTGATSSAIVQSVADRLGLSVDPGSTMRLQGATGTATVPYVVAGQMEVGDLLIGKTKLPVVADVFGGAEGVLGTRGLLDKRIHIDFRNDLVEIDYARGERRPVGMSVVPFDVLRGRLTAFEIMVGGVRTKAIIDTGAQRTVGNNRLRELLLLRQRETADMELIGVTLDVTQGDSIGVPPIHLGGSVQVHNLHIAFGEMPIFAHWELTREPAMLIGMDIIGSLDAFIIDYRRREVYLRARRTMKFVR